jgi:hypothetical protein
MPGLCLDSASHVMKVDMSGRIGDWRCWVGDVGRWPVESALETNRVVKEAVVKTRTSIAKTKTWPVEA